MTLQAVDREPTPADSGFARTARWRIKDIIERRPELALKYETARRVVRAFRKPAFYEVSQRCNLKCEGCYFFEGAGATTDREQHAVGAWNEFFAAEAARHITMAYFVGAEPALEQERLHAAAQHLTCGNIGTNGTVRIDSAIPFRVSIAVWAGDDATDRKLRGAPAFRKAFKNYAGDPRAIIIYTLSPWNLDGARTIAEMCRDHGLPLTFNMFSPTATFLDKLSNWRGNDDKFFRLSRPDSTPCFTDEDLSRTRRVIAGVMEDFSETVLYSKSYNEWVTGAGPRYAIDPQTGVAEHCGSRLTGGMSFFHSDLQAGAPKCCTPDIDCSQCRIFSGGWSTKLQPSGAELESEEAFADWLDTVAIIGKIFLTPTHKLERIGPMPALSS
ncbi:MAG: hypothetical protein ABUS57_07445 [Pseudomonadota bacterium]